MSKLNFSKYRFRPSQLPLLMSKPKSKSEILSETCKGVLGGIFIKEKYGREAIITSKYLTKGIEQESDSISLYRQVTQTFGAKNKKKYQNSWLAGTPDLVLKDKVVDVKTNWDIWTFFGVDEAKARKDYYYQLVAYMILAKKKKAELAYCLVNNTEAVMYSEFMKIKYAKGLDDTVDSLELEELDTQIRKNNTYDDIPKEDRIKVYNFELDKEEVELIKTKLTACREYLNNLI